MNPSRGDQETPSEAETTETSRSEAFDKWLCSNPGHSAQQRAIVAHMTPDERREFQRLSSRGGAVLGLIMTGALCILMLVSSYTEFGAVGLVVCLVVYLPVASLMFLGVQRSAQNFLRSTAWYKAQGWE